MIEIAGRSIGGLCSRTLRFGLGLSLEELILRHALGRDVSGLDREGGAAGVMMIPIPKAGTLEEVTGLDEAKATDAIEDVIITAPLGRRLVPLPEGSSYLGFIFARATTPARSRKRTTRSPPKATLRDQLMADTRARALPNGVSAANAGSLRRSVIRVSSRRVVGRVHDRADLGDGLAD